MLTVSNKICPKKHERIIFIYYHPEILGDQKEYNKTIFKNKNFKIEHEIIKDSKYFFNYTNAISSLVTYNIPFSKNNLTLVNSYYYSTESFACSYIYGKNNGLKIHTNKYPTQIFCRYPYYKENFNKINSYIQYFNLKVKFPNDFNFFPETYIIKDKNDIPSQFLNYIPTLDNLWIRKPKDQVGGKGISIFTNIQQIEDNIILSKYITNPFLVNGRKFDIRIYVLVTGVKPLKIYLGDEGQLNICIKEYNLTLDNLNERLVHITNHGYQSKYENYIPGIDYNSEKGNDWTIKLLKNYFKKNNYNWDYVWSQIKDVSIKTIISYQEKMVNQINKYKLNDRLYSQLFGFDILIDQNLKVWVLETNSNPGLASSIDKPRETLIKTKASIDSFNIIGFFLGSHGKNGTYYDEIYHYNNEVEKNVDDALCEFGRPTGQYKRIFPLKDNIDKYKKFFLNKVEENEKLWEIIKNMEDDI